MANSLPHGVDKGEAPGMVRSPWTALTRTISRKSSSTLPAHTGHCISQKRITGPVSTWPTGLQNGSFPTSKKRVFGPHKVARPHNAHSSRIALFLLKSTCPNAVLVDRASSVTGYQPHGEHEIEDLVIPAALPTATLSACRDHRRQNLPAQDRHALFLQGLQGGRLPRACATRAGRPCSRKMWPQFFLPFRMASRRVINISKPHVSSPCPTPSSQRRTLALLLVHRGTPFNKGFSRSTSH